MHGPKRPMSTPAAWHPDPLNWHQLRYWDGDKWTDHVADDGTTTLDPVSRGPRPVQPTQPSAPAPQPTPSPLTQGNAESSRQPWVPKVDLDSAQAAIYALVRSIPKTDAQVRGALEGLTTLSGQVADPDEYAKAISQDSHVKDRPWVWLLAVMDAAAASGDHALACAALFWSIHWSATLVPGNRKSDFFDLRLYPIPAPIKLEISRIGTLAARSLPPDTLIVDDASGSVCAGDVARAGPLLPQMNFPPQVD
jgi:Protein of unknown function (DUF2510)